MRVLLVDDNAALRMLLRTTFEVFDIDVEEADSAEAASEAIRSFQPDVLVLDVRMPGMDGLEVCRRVKADPASRSARSSCSRRSNGWRERSTASRSAPRGRTIRRSS